jgi:cytochrome c oxidase assembly factor CtaG
MTRRALLALAAFAAANPAEAHNGHLHWWELDTTWTWNPLVLVPLLISAGVYATGVARVWRRAGADRGVKAWQVASFAGGWLLLVAALVSPLHWLGERLFTAHMIEHEILMTLAAPLLVLAHPVGAMMWGLPASARRLAGGIGRSPAVARGWAILASPSVATVLHGAALWIWHAPRLYEAALTSTFVHWLQHLSFLVTALIFWWALLWRGERESRYGLAVFYLFATALHSGFLGVLLTSARAPVYPLQTQAATDWGLLPLEDQQLAGIVMWVPAGLIYAVAAVLMAGVWIAQAGSEGERRAASQT